MNNVITYVLLNDDPDLKFDINFFNHQLATTITPRESIEFTVEYSQENLEKVKNLPLTVTSIAAYNAFDDKLSEDEANWIKQSVAITSGQEIDYKIAVLYVAVVR